MVKENETRYEYHSNSGRVSNANYTPLDEGIKVTNLMHFYYYRYSKDFKFAGESHNFYEFFYVVEGNMLLVSGDKVTKLSQNQYVLVPPNVKHAMNSDNNFCASISVAFSAENVHEILNEMCPTYINAEEKYLLNLITNNYVNNFKNDGYFKNRLLAISLEKNEYAHCHIIKALLESLLILITRDQLENAVNPSEVRGIDSKENKTAKEIYNYLKEHYTDKITLQDISNGHNYSVGHICRIFKKQYGESIMNCLIRLRLRNVLELLASTDLKINECALQSGFDDVQYFTRLFKKYVGITPSKYRRYCKQTGIMNTIFILSEVI